LNWHESCDAQKSVESSRGFGSSLLDRLAQQLGGTIDKDFAPEGLRVSLVAPVRFETPDRHPDDSSQVMEEQS
jgi:two-component sensor histidine kinase